MKCNINITVDVTDFFEGEEVKKGLQNVMDEFDGNNGFIVELANREVVREYRKKLVAILNNPMLKRFAGVMNNGR